MSKSVLKAVRLRKNLEPLKIHMHGHWLWAAGIPLQERKGVTIRVGVKKSLPYFSSVSKTYNPLRIELPVSYMNEKLNKTIDMHHTPPYIHMFMPSH